jgi:aryl-alcohol dehydrogenase-like predicted oxidoreductase
LIDKDAVPILGAKNRAQAKENAAGMGWNLNSKESID